MDWAVVISSLFQMVIIPLLAFLTKTAVDFLTAKKEETKAKIENQYYNKYFSMLIETVCDCVSATNQTYVESLKKQGKFDAEAQKTAFQATYDAVLGLLTEDAKAYLRTVYEDLPGLLTTLIEAEVNKQK